MPYEMASTDDRMRLLLTVELEKAKGGEKSKNKRCDYV